MKILVYIGLNVGESFSTIFHRYDKAYGFEANPNLIPKLNEKFEKFPQVEIIHAAVSDYDGEIEFYINENHTSSSLGEISMDYKAKINPMNEGVKVMVPSVNLNNFFEKKSIDFIDTYVSDIEGWDLQVLKTISEFIDQRRIKSIQVESEADRYDFSGHNNQPANKSHDIIKFLDKNYSLIRKFPPEKGNENWFSNDLYFELK